MVQQYRPPLGPHAKAFIEKWETDVHAEMRATTLAMLTCCPFERAYHRGTMKTLGDVLDLLHGKNTLKMTTGDLKIERSHCQRELQKAKDDYQQIVATCQAQEKSNRHLKMQLCQQFNYINKIQKENEVLHHQINSMGHFESHKLKGCPPASERKPGVPFLDEAAHKIFESKLTDQRQLIAELKAKLLEAKRKIHGQRQENKDVLLNRERKWSEKAEALQKNILSSQRFGGGRGRLSVQR